MGWSVLRRGLLAQRRLVLLCLWLCREATPLHSSTGRPYKTAHEGLASRTLSMSTMRGSANFSCAVSSILDILECAVRS